jgi:hypothetical protein
MRWSVFGWICNSAAASSVFRTRSKPATSSSGGCSTDDLDVSVRKERFSRRFKWHLQERGAYHRVAGKQAFSPTTRDGRGRFAPSANPLGRQLPRLCTNSTFNAIVCVDTLAFAPNICNHKVDGAQSPTADSFHSDLGCPA